jgi:hypothetical protein
VDIARLPAGRVLSQDDGESLQVYEIAGHSGWLAKIYKKPLAAAEAHTLKQVIHLPRGMTQRSRDLVNGCVAWPVATINSRTQTVGVVMAKAPLRFSARLRKLSGGFGDARPLEIDWLAMPSESASKRGIKPPDAAVRTKAMLQMLQVGAVFDGDNLVYGDWSYKNAFWEQGDGSVFVIDMDSCGIDTREWIASPEWEDPLFPDSTKPRLTPLSDRYKLAVFVVRCLTGERKDPLAAHRSLVESEGVNPFTVALWRVLTAKTAEERPDPLRLLAAYQSWQAEKAGNVSGSVAVGRGPRADGGRAPKAGPNADGRDARAAQPVRPSPGNVTGQIDLRARRNGQQQPPSARAPAAAATDLWLHTGGTFPTEFRHVVQSTVKGETR